MGWGDYWGGVSIRNEAVRGSLNEEAASEQRLEGHKRSSQVEIQGKSIWAERQSVQRPCGRRVPGVFPVRHGS